MGTITDPVADMLARIRNANTAFAERVDVPASRVKLELAKLLGVSITLADLYTTSDKRRIGHDVNKPGH